MKAIMLMYDSLNRRMLSPYGCGWTKTPNFQRLAEHSVTFDNCYVGSMPCMPARRELHTGRYNFLHRSWGPLEPFDDSMPQILNMAGIHTHLATDHYHYFEDGGATYHTRYTTWEGFRGQEGDAWKGLAGAGGGAEGWERNFRVQDEVNRSFLQREEDMPQSRTVQAGLDFLADNHDRDGWFLQVECFDPHEPFFSRKEYHELYPETWEGDDWPEYRALDDRDTPERVRHMRLEYAALLSMCDRSLGRVLDAMDRYGLWEDTMLIVNTDHGFLLAEHGFWAKCHCPFYNEVAHTPLFLWDPRTGIRGRRAQSLVQTIDLPATLLEYFGLPLPPDMQGHPLRGVIERDEPVREGALFGIHGGQVNCTDGRYVYMRSPVPGNQPLCQYTLMPMKHGGRRAFLDDEELKTMEIHPPFSFTKGIPVLETNGVAVEQAPKYKTELYDLQNDPRQLCPIQDAQAEQRMIRLMVKLMKENDCPPEQFIRLGLTEEDIAAV